METGSGFSLAMTSLALLFNIIGLKLLREVKNIKPTQKVLLSNLSVSDSLNAVTAVTGITLIDSITTKEKSKLAFGTLGSFCVLVSCASLIIITIDRVIATAMPLRYIVLATRKRCIIVVICAWVSTFVFISALLSTCSLVDIHAYTFCMTLPTEVIIIASYSVILIKTRRQRKISGMKNLHETKQGRKMLVVSCGIVVSFACLVAIPDLLIYLMADEREKFILMVQMYYFINPLIYIYCYPPLRELVKEKFRALIARPGLRYASENGGARSAKIERPQSDTRLDKK